MLLRAGSPAVPRPRGHFLVFRRTERLTKRVQALRIGVSVHYEANPFMNALLTTNLGVTPLLGRGKVRDLYAVDDALLLVATDRISAFDHILGTGIPG